MDMHPPPAYVHVAQAETQPSAEAPTREVAPLDIGKYLPPTANYATILVTVTPPTGTVIIYTPGYESSPAVFKGPVASGEIHVAGPTVYVSLQDGATGYDIRYLNWHEP